LGSQGNFEKFNELWDSQGNCERNSIVRKNREFWRQGIVGGPGDCGRHSELWEKQESRGEPGAS
jgi:hypothetical protein